MLEYDSTLVRILGATTGAATGSFALLVNRDLPFPPQGEKNANILLQLSGTGSFQGSDQEILLLQIASRVDADSSTSLDLDHEPTHSQFVTSDGFEIAGDNLHFVADTLTLEAARFAVSGSVAYIAAGEPVAGAILDLQHSGGVDRDTTGADGTYRFPAIRRGAASLSPAKQDDQRNAISGADAVLTLRTLAFLDTLSANQQRAADVNENGSLSGADAVALLRTLAFLPTPGAYPGEWRFLPPSINFELASDTLANFSAYLLGDVTLNWGSQGNRVAALAARHMTVVAQIRIADAQAAVDDTLEVPVVLSSDSAFSFVQVTIAYDSTALQFLDARAGANAQGMNFLVNAAPPFSPPPEDGNRSLVLQLASAAAAISGADQEIAIVQMRAIGTPDSQTSLVPDSDPGHTVLTTVHLNDISGTALTLLPGTVSLSPATGVSDQEAVLPQEFGMAQNYPNPFNPSTVIPYQLPVQSFVELEIYNLVGQVVRTLVQEEKAPGYYRATWDGRNDAGILLPSGLYFSHLQAGDFQTTRRMVFLK